MWRTVGHDNQGGLVCHFHEVLVVLWANWIRCCDQAFLVGGPVGTRIPNPQGTIAPRHRIATTLRHRGVVGFYGGRGGVHEQEEHGRKGIVPCPAEGVAILFVRPAEYSRAAHPGRNRDQSLATYIMGRTDSRHAGISLASARWLLAIDPLSARPMNR